VSTKQATTRRVKKRQTGTVTIRNRFYTQKWQSVEYPVRTGCEKKKIYKHLAF
jgi:hypothetical protein